MPDWIVDHQSPFKTGRPDVASDSSDSDLPVDPAPTLDKTGPSRPFDAGPSASQRPVADEPAEASREGNGETKLLAAATGKPAASGLATPALPGEIPVVLPDKIPKTKALVELTGGDGPATDLSGDVGVVGRWIVHGQPGNKGLKLDLKGIVYGATIVPSAATICILNVGPSGAKVESVMSEFLQLREEGNFRDLEATLEGDEQEDMYMDSDDAMAGVYEIDRELAKDGHGEMEQKKRKRKDGGHKSTTGGLATKGWIVAKATGAAAKKKSGGGSTKGSRGAGKKGARGKRRGRGK
eukprot:evm.model.scf_392.9 EVM.evm.TU.scf_392.9   scf_392:58316-60022(-)